MSQNMSRTAYVLTLLGVAAVTNTANAQYYGGVDPCACLQPVAQTCYQTVPVTEYRQVKQTVQRPVVETKYVDQAVTEYVPVTEARTAQVPTVSYQNVTECRVVQHNASYWQTRYEAVPRYTPCEYDNRPGLFGWLNRTGYEVRSAFRPRTVARREYVPNMITRAVPVSRQVAVRGTRQVTYNVTKMVPRTTTRKVAVNTVRYVNEEVVAMQPVTVMRTVPTGTSTAYMYSPYGAIAPQTVLGPVPDPVSRSADADSDDDDRSASNDPNPFDNTNYRSNSDDSRVNGALLSVPKEEKEETSPAIPEGYRVAYSSRDAAKAVNIASNAPSIVRVSGWRARSVSPTSVPSSTGPKLIPPGITIAGN